ncbi:glycosyltransferase [Candidatus Dependentiae bacterium]
MKNKKEIQVLYVITKLELGGAQKVCLSLFDGLQLNGCESFLISGKHGELAKRVESDKNVFLLKHFRHKVSLKTVFLEIKNFIDLVNKIRALKHQHTNLIVHTHSTKAGLVGRWAAFFAGVKKRVHTVHGYGFHKHQNKIAWLITYFLELITSFITTHYICVSSEDVKIGTKLFPRFTKKHSIIRAAVDWNQFYIPARKTTPFPEHKHAFVFGTVSCFKKQKNLLDLFKAFEYAYSQNHNIKLEVVGDGHLRPEFEAWIAAHDLENKIILHGWQEKVAPFMIEWNAFVMSSLWEGLPCAIVEARLLKLPVLSYKTGGIHDVIVHGENGFLYKQGNWRELASGMLALSANQYLYKKLQDYEEDLSDFNNQQMVKQHLELYKEL